MPEAKLIDTNALGAYTEALRNKLVRIYTAKGSAIYADTDYLASANKASPAINETGLWQQVNGNWTKITSVLPGWVYNITNKFTTDSNFVDGANVTPAVGTNIAVVNVGTDANPVLKFDLLATGIDFNPAVMQDKQDKVLSTEHLVCIPDHSVADSTAREALTSATVSDGDYVFQEDTEEYYYTQVNGTTVVFYDIGNTKTVEGMLKLLSSVMPVKPISTAEIQAMFA